VTGVLATAGGGYCKRNHNQSGDVGSQALPSPEARRGEDMSIFAELWHFMRVRKKYWLLPIIMMMALFGGLIVLTQGTAVAPFIYTVF
jgi:hypothetical protein